MEENTARKNICTERIDIQIWDGNRVPIFNHGLVLLQYAEQVLPSLPIICIRQQGQLSWHNTTIRSPTSDKPGISYSGVGYTMGAWLWMPTEWTSGYNEDKSSYGLENLETQKSGHPVATQRDCPAPSSPLPSTILAILRIKPLLHPPFIPTSLNHYIASGSLAWDSSPAIATTRWPNDQCWDDRGRWMGALYEELGVGLKPFCEGCGDWGQNQCAGEEPNDENWSCNNQRNGKAKVRGWWGLWEDDEDTFSKLEREPNTLIVN